MKSKRALSFLMALVLCLSLLPFGAFADETETAEPEAEAIIAEETSEESSESAEAEETTESEEIAESDANSEKTAVPEEYVAEEAEESSETVEGPEETDFDGGNTYTINGVSFCYDEITSSSAGCRNYANDFYNKICRYRFSSNSTSAGSYYLTVTTKEMSNITSSSASYRVEFAGYVMGTYEIGVQLSLDAVNFYTADSYESYEEQRVYYSGWSQCGIQNLAAGTTYYYRAYSRVGSTYCYGETKSFTTLKRIGFDVNGYLDGEYIGSVSGYGTFDVYINDVLVANDVANYCNDTLSAGDEYSICDIRAADGCVYKGVYCGALTGTLTDSNLNAAGRVETCLSFKTKTFTVTYNANGGSGAPSSGTKTYGKNYTIPTTKPTRNGYTFLGWATSKSATTAKYKAGYTYSTLSSATLYAVWQKASYYTVTYNANGGSGAPSSGKKYYNSSYTISSTKPTRTGYTFVGWATSKTATTAKYYAGKSYTSLDSSTLYAVWKAKTFTVKYYANGGTGAPASGTKTWGKSYTIPSTKPTRTGYTFVGWATSKTATTAKYYAGKSYTSLDSGTLYAVWQKNSYYTVTYNANGGSGAPSSGKKYYNSSYTISSTKPTRSGYTFLGWATSSTATTAKYKAGYTYSTLSSATLYAVWQKSSSTNTSASIPRVLTQYGYSSQDEYATSFTFYADNTCTFKINMLEYMEKATFKYYLYVANSGKRVICISTSGYTFAVPHEIPYILLAEESSGTWTYYGESTGTVYRDYETFVASGTTKTTVAQPIQKTSADVKSGTYNHYWTVYPDSLIISNVTSNSLTFSLSVYRMMNPIEQEKATVYGNTAFFDYDDGYGCFRGYMIFNNDGSIDLHILYNTLGYDNGIFTFS